MNDSDEDEASNDEKRLANLAELYGRSEDWWINLYTN